MIQLEKTWIVVCRTNFEFDTRQAAIQRQQFMENHTRKGWDFICLTDQPTESWHVKLKTQLPGWWSLMEMFSMKGPHILTGLDTILTGDLNPLLEFAEKAPPETIYGVRDFYHPSRWASGITLWNGDWEWLLHSCTDEERRCFRGDQDFIEHYVKKADGKSLGYLQDHIGGIVSYKAHVLKEGLKPNDRVCCFHGNPRPWQVAHQHDWVYRAMLPKPPRVITI